MAFHRAAADLHRGGYLGLGQVGVIPQDQRLALTLGQTAERGDDRGPLQQDKRAVLGARHVRGCLLQVLVDDRPVPENRT
jgi:hypothetical protein